VGGYTITKERIEKPCVVNLVGLPPQSTISWLRHIDCFIYGYFIN
jgi:hypothetical protein